MEFLEFSQDANVSESKISLDDESKVVLELEVIYIYMR